MMVCRSYIGIPAFIFFYFFWKILHRTKTIPLKEIDLVSGKREIDLEEEKYLAEQALKGPQTRWKRFWDAL
jgi:amino acid transporter